MTLAGFWVAALLWWPLCEIVRGRDQRIGGWWSLALLLGGPLGSMALIGVGALIEFT